MDYDRCCDCEARERRALSEAAADAAFNPEYDPAALKTGIVWFEGTDDEQRSLMCRLLREWRGAAHVIEPEPGCQLGVVIALHARALGGALDWEAEVSARGWRMLPPLAARLGLERS